MSIDCRRIASSAPILLGAFGTATAVAQSVVDAGFMLEEIIVTARRVEENLQNTPVSITALTGAELEQRQIFSSQDLHQVAPNLQFTNDTTLAGNNASSIIFIRGIGQTDPTSTVDPGVGLYIDDVYMGQSVGGTLQLRDIANVQVLRGPQGTLFGRNTIGGAIVLTTRDPGYEFGGEYRLGAGSYNMLDTFIGVDIPGSERFRSRLTFGTFDREGYVTRVQTGEDLGDADTYTATGKLVWDLSDVLQVKLQFDYTKSDENGNAFVSAASTETATFQRVASADAGCPGFAGVWDALPAVPLIDDDRCANDFQDKGPYANNGTHPIESTLENWGTSLHINYEINDAWTLKSVSSLRSLEWEGIRDADNTPLTILHTDYDSDGNQFSQEFQFLYFSDTLRGVAGFYYFEEEVVDLVYVELNTPAPGVQADSNNNTTRNDSWAVFSQWSYDVTSAFALTVGGRYTADSKGSIPDQFAYTDPTVKFLPVQLYEDRYDAFTANVALSYHWSDRTMGYVSYAEGFKGGGWNSHFNRRQTPAEQAQFQKFDQEEAQTLEVGFKLDLAEDSLRLNGALFATDYDDLQFTYRVGVAPYLANAGKASISGAEVELTWVPSSEWLIEAGVGSLDTSVDSLRTIAGTGIGVAAGNALPFAPELQANFGVSYAATLNSGALVTRRVDLFYQDRTYFDANNTAEIAQLDSVSVVNLSVGYEPAGAAWRLTFGVTNATDQIYPTGGNSSLTTGSGYAEIAYALARQYFLSFTNSF